MHGIDVQMSSDRCADAVHKVMHMAVQIQGQGPWVQTNKLLVKS